MSPGATALTPSGAAGSFTFAHTWPLYRAAYAPAPRLNTQTSRGAKTADTTVTAPEESRRSTHEGTG